MNRTSFDCIWERIYEFEIPKPYVLFVFAQHPGQDTEEDTTFFCEENGRKSGASEGATTGAKWLAAQKIALHELHKTQSLRTQTNEPFVRSTLPEKVKGIFLFSLLTKFLLLQSARALAESYLILLHLGADLLFSNSQALLVFCFCAASW